MKLVLAFLLVVPTASPARAQTFDFRQPQQSFLAAMGQGYLPDYAADTIDLDQNGDGSTDGTWNLPAEIRSVVNTILQHRLSPTERYMVTMRAAAPFTGTTVCGGSPQNVQVYYHRIDPEPVLVSLGSGCVRGPIAIGPLWWDQEVPPTTGMVVASASSTAGSQQVLWADLANGAVAVDNATFGPNVSVSAEGLRFSPFGNAAFVRHGTVTALPDRYSIVDLCADPLGGNVSTRDEPLLLDGITPRLIVDGSDLSVEVELDVSGTTQTQVFGLENCFTGPPPPPPPPDPVLTVTVAGSGAGGVLSQPAGVQCVLGDTCAAPFATGTLVSLRALPAQGTGLLSWSGDCAGTGATSTVLLDGDRSCTATFGSVALQIDKSATPSSIRAGDELVYEIHYRNDGTAPANNVIVRDAIPPGATLVDAGGGTLAGGALTWSVGTLPAGASESVQFRVAAQCSATELRNTAYSVASLESALPVVGPPVLTPVAAASTDPVDVAVASVPARTPLRTGDLVTHTITLTNTVAEERRGIQLVVSAGADAFLDSVVDPGTGAVTQTTQFTWSWAGDLGPSASTSVVITSRVDDCISTTETTLNLGNPLVVMNACGAQVGTSNAPAAIPLEPPLATQLEVLGLPPGRVDDDFWLARPGETFQLQMSVTDQYGQDQPSVSFQLPLPDGLSAVGDPPFAPPTEPGAAWDPSTRTATWTGTVPANATVRVTVDVTLDADAPCRLFVTASGGSGSCSNIFDRRTLLSVPEPPTDPYLLGLDAFGGLFLWEPGVDRNFAEHLCLSPVEILVDMDLGSGDRVGITGLPSFFFDGDPLSLDIEKPIFGGPPFLGVTSEPTAVAHDPTDGTWVYAVAEVQGGHPTSLRRLDPVSGQFTVIANGLPHVGDLEIEDDGTLVASMILPAPDEIWRIDPADPTNPVVLSDPAYPSLAQLELDHDGDYVAIHIGFDPSSGSFFDLVEIERSSGTFTRVVQDIDAFLGLGSTVNYSMAVADTGEVYLLNREGAVGVVERGPALSGSLLANGGTVAHGRSPGVFDDDYLALLWVGGGGPPPPPTEADVQLTMSASADPVIAGGSLVYTAAVVNLGPDIAASVSIENPLPAGLSFEPALSDAACTEAAGVVTCDAGTLAPGANASFAVAVQIDPTTAGALTNTATVASATLDPNPSNDDASITVTVLPPAPTEADLGIAKTASPDPAVLGSPLTYAITVTNAGPSDATGVVVTDVLPPGVVYDPASSDPGCVESAGTVTCQIGALASGAQSAATVVVVPTLPADLAVTRYDLSIDHAVNVGDSLLYEIDVTNHGPGLAEDVRLFTLGAGFDDQGFPLGPIPSLTPLSVVTTHGTCPDPLATVPLECLFGDLAPGETATLAIAVSVDGASGPLPRTVSNAARVTTGATVATGVRNDPDPDDDERSVVNVVAAATGSDLRLRTMTVAPDEPVVLGENLTYALEVENLGPNPAQNVVLHALARAFDPATGSPTGAPLELNVVSATPSQGTCVDTGGVNAGPLECALGALDPGAVATLTVVVTPTAPSFAAGQPAAALGHQARIDASDDPNPGNDAASVASLVLPSSGAADLGLTELSVAPVAPVLLGESLTYSLEVTNFGPDAVQDAVLFALGRIFDASGAPIGPSLDVKVDAFASSQGTCADLGNTDSGPLRCDLGALAAGATAMVTVTVTPASATVGLGQAQAPLVHVARVTTESALLAGDADADPNRDNDEASVASKVLPERPSALSNRATVSGDLPDPDPSDDAAILSTPLVAPPPAPRATSDLTLTLGGPSAGTVGVEVPLTVQVINSGPDVAAGATVVIELSPGLGLFSVATDVGACFGQTTVVCELGAFPVAGAALIRLDATPLGAGAPTVSARVSSLSQDPAPGDNAGGLTLSIGGGADLQLTKLVDVDPAIAGASVTYELDVTNAGPLPATAVSVEDELPPELVPGSVTTTHGSCQQNGASVSCQIGTLASGAGATIVVTATVPAATAPGTVLTNTATASASEPDPDTSNDSASVSVSVAALSDVSLQKSGPAGPSPASAPVPFQLVVANAGPSMAAGVVVTDPLPAGTTFDPSASDARCVESGGVVSCALGELAPGAQDVAAIAVVAGPGTFVNSATVSATTTDPNASNDADSASATVIVAFTENMDPEDVDAQFAYGELAGWIDLEPLGDGGPGLEVTDTEVRGWFWGETVGWCSASCENTASCANVDYRVSNDGQGRLAGDAWCEDVGWIAFSCENTSSCATSPWGVSIDPDTGVFSGEAWSESVEWIAFSSPTGAFQAMTGWRAPALPTVEGLLEALRGEVLGLVRADELGRLPAIVLDLQIRVAELLWDRSSRAAACFQMDRFTKTVALFERLGLLEPDTADALSSRAPAIRQAMGC